MIHWRHAQVLTVRREWDGARELDVLLSAPLPGRTAAETVRALAYTELVGSPEPGDEVLLNVSALARGLGTGGFALVVAAPHALPDDPPPGPGHLVKDRYSPLQTMVLGVDDEESEHHGVLADAQHIDGMPVVVADLHSALPAVLAGIHAEDPALRVVYVMTDGAALPLALSRAVSGLRRAGRLHATITAGQAWGGDLESVTVHTALLAARWVCRADIVIMAQGPGNLGTGTRFGFSGMMVGDHLNAAALLEGQPIAALRMSDADPRPRHRGISHHTLTAVGRGARAGCAVPVPDLHGLSDAEASRCESDPRAVAELMEEQLTGLRDHVLHRIALDGLLDALEASPVGLSTMGRGLHADPASFLAAAAAGRYAARAVRGRT